MAYFPMFIELKNMPCLVVGGGKMAVRKVKVLQDFDAEVTVLAKEFLPVFYEMEQVLLRKKTFGFSDLQGFQLVVAATDDEKLNHEIALECKRRGIFVNAVDQPSDCSFIFPAYVKEGDVVAAFSSGGKSPVIAQYLKEIMKENIPAELEEAADFLGSIRDTVKDRVEKLPDRKELYQRLLEYIVETHHLPEDSLLETMIEEYRNEEEK